MEKIEKRKQGLKKILLRLQESLEKMESAADYEMVRDSAIKRFELCYDVFWKCMKDLLYDKHGITIASPKGVFKESLEQEVISQKDLDELSSIHEDRNLATYLYDEDCAQSLAQRLDQHYQCFKRLSTLFFD
ncbi:MAG: nucleotidyltransferase substrate binding protein [Epsilonproteobacteria bacterium]|nr:nucleotidyltransferase substrate binding protein [Campylobacterota bacterium]